jgi:hypothetical protein
MSAGVGLDELLGAIIAAGGQQGGKVTYRCTRVSESVEPSHLLAETPLMPVETAAASAAADAIFATRCTSDP